MRTQVKKVTETAKRINKVHYLSKNVKRPTSIFRASLCLPNNQNMLMIDDQKQSNPLTNSHDFCGTQCNGGTTRCGFDYGAKDQRYVTTDIELVTCVHCKRIYEENNKGENDE